MTSRFRGMLWSLASIAAAASMLLAVSTTALADDPIPTLPDAPTTSTQTPNSGQSAAPDATSANTSSLQSTTTVDATTSSNAPQNDANSDTSQTPAATVDAECAPAKWQVLKACIEGATGDTLVTITAPITVAKGDSIAIDGKNITLTSTIPANEKGERPSALSLVDGDNVDSLFTVSNSGSLTIGKDATDASFVYSGTEDKPLTRRFATVNDDKSSFTVNNGAFRYLRVSDSAGTFGQNTTTAAVAVNQGGAIVVNNGTFSNNTTETQFLTGLFSQSAGSLTINNGTFKGNKGVRGSIISVPAVDEKTTIDIHGGTFENNSTAFAGGVIMQNSHAGVMTISGGTFTGNSSGTRGGVVHNNGTMTVSGGTFTGNKAYGQGGGVISEEGGAKLSVVPSGDNTVTFSNNGQTFKDDVLNECYINKGANDDCNKGNQNYGGGVIWAGPKDDSYPRVNIQGNVVFDSNYSNAWGYMLGGGAIFMAGELWIQNDARGNKPRFVNNYAGVRQREVKEDGTIKTALRGGAGGAIFLQEGKMSENNTKSTSMAYIMGGDFENNTSGYLGGAVYTESHSITYVAKAVAYGNTAGHFGGGLWLCPSGTGTASKGGNIALFDNEVDKSIDPNVKANDGKYPNDVPYTGTGLTQWDNDGTTEGNKRIHGKIDGTGTEAGDDFAIMNPMWKGEITKTDFQLMDTWFTDRVNSAVDWYEDGTPVKGASGFQDYFQDPDIVTNVNGWHHGDGGGTNLAVTMNGTRYKDAKTPTKVDIDTKTHTHTIKLTRTMDANKGLTTGYALKAVVKGNTKAEQEQAKNAAKSAAAITFTGNAARLSGGAFATNGDVKFSTPWTASWTKTDDNTDTSKRVQLAGSEWLISTTDDGDASKGMLGGPYDSAFYPSMCAVDDSGVLTEAGKVAWEAGTCWKEEKSSKNGTTTTVRTAIIKDNTASDKGTPDNYAYNGFDNNPDGGGFDINNLANGTYTITERKAPTGYTPNTTADGKSVEYAFTIADAQAQWNNGSGNATTLDKDITNTALKGVSWGKIDADTRDKVTGSVWQVTLIKDKDGKDVANATPHMIDDCVDAADTAEKDNKCAVKNKDKVFADKDGTDAAGMFNISVDVPGTYKLQEVTAPEGYWQPASNKSYQFTVKANDDSAVKIYESDGKTEVKDNNIVNQRPTVAWSKVASDNDGLLYGSEWTIRGPLTKNADGTFAEVSGKTITAAVTDCSSTNGWCATQSNNLDGTDGTDKTYQDIDEAKGKLRVAGLAPAPSEKTGETTEYWYELTETKAPSGFVLAKTTYTFSVGYRQPTASIRISAPTDASLPVKHDATTGPNAIQNVRAVAELPFTGGTDARDWLLIGGGIGLAGALVLALINEYRKRRGLA